MIKKEVPKESLDNLIRDDRVLIASTHYVFNVRGRVSKTHKTEAPYNLITLYLVKDDGSIDVVINLSDIKRVDLIQNGCLISYDIELNDGFKFNLR